MKGGPVRPVLVIDLLVRTALLGLVLAANAWVIDSRNGFLFDDYDWFARVKFATYDSLGGFFPAHAYNDRPAGAILIKILWSLFGLNAAPYHWVFLFIHVCNVFLVFEITARLAKEAAARAPVFAAFASGAIFGCWPRSLMAVQWGGAVFDLLGATFLLLSTLAYLQVREERRYETFRTLVAVGFFWLALRTKEMTIVLPGLLLLLEAALLVQKGGLREIGRLRQARLALWLILGTGGLYAGLLVRLVVKGMTILQESTSPYFLSYRPDVLFVNLFKYVLLYFDLSRNQFVFMGMGMIQWAVLALVAVALAASWVFSFRKRNVLPVVLEAGFLLTLGPVLPMKNMQHVLYLYIPSILLAVLLGSTLAVLRGRVEKRWGGMLLGGILGGLLLGATRLPPVQIYRNWWLSLSAKDKVGIDSLKKIARPEPGSTIFVRGAETPYNVFNPNGPGNINKVVFSDQTLKTRFDTPGPDEAGAYLVLDLDAESGEVKEIERGMGQPLPEAERPRMEALEVGPSSTERGVGFNRQPNGLSAIWVRCRHARRRAQLFWEETPLATTYESGDVLTAFVPEPLFEKPGRYGITIRDPETGERSSAVFFEVR